MKTKAALLVLVLLAALSVAALAEGRGRTAKTHIAIRGEAGGLVHGRVRSHRAACVAPARVFAYEMLGSKPDPHTDKQLGYTQTTDFDGRWQIAGLHYENGKSYYARLPWNRSCKSALSKVLSL